MCSLFMKVCNIYNLHVFFVIYGSLVEVSYSMKGFKNWTVKIITEINTIFLIFLFKSHVNFMMLKYSFFLLIH